MNEEQRAVLAAIGRMEQGGGTLIDEYTVAQDAGIVRGELSGQEYAQSPERAEIRRLLEELELGGMVRLHREGYWRPRTTLAGRRAWQNPDADLLPSAVVATTVTASGGRPSAAPIPDIFGDDADDDGDARREAPYVSPRRASAGEDGGARGWPSWWPAALRLGDPSRTPLIGGIAGALVALLLLIFLVTRVAGAGRAAPTPTLAAIAQTATTFASQPTQTPAPPSPSAQVSGGGTAATSSGASNRPTAAPTATQSRAPTATAGPAAAKVRIANTELQGAFLYATAAGERTKVAIPEGTLVEVAGPDERDQQGRNWKHIRWGSETYWILEEYTTPAE